MTTTAQLLVWRGRSGREYTPAGKSRLRHGNLASVRKVVGRGGPIGTSTVADGVPLALKLWREGDERSLDQLQLEARALVELASHGGELPCPRLFDLVGDNLVTGLVMEWCPFDLERWWREKLHERDAFGRLMAVMGEAARRVAEYHTQFASRTGLGAAHGDLKPSNILMAADGRWLVSDFGAKMVPPPEDDVWAESRIVVATDNFLAPEAIFNATRPHPAAADTFSLCASLFALLKMKRMVEDGSVLPRNGCHSPRFRSERVSRVFEVYGRDPRRFLDRPLEAFAFPEPERLPDDDRRVTRDGLRGVFGPGPDTSRREDLLAEKIIALMDRGLAIDPGRRFVDARELALAFEDLTREFITLSAEVSTSVPLPAEPSALVAELSAAEQRNDLLRQRLQELEQHVAALEAGGAEIPQSVELDDPTDGGTFPIPVIAPQHASAPLQQGAEDAGFTSDPDDTLATDDVVLPAPASGDAAARPAEEAAPTGAPSVPPAPRAPGVSRTTSAERPASGDGSRERVPTEADLAAAAALKARVATASVSTVLDLSEEPAPEAVPSRASTMVMAPPPRPDRARAKAASAPVAAPVDASEAGPELRQPVVVKVPFWVTLPLVTSLALHGLTLMLLAAILFCVWPAE